MIFQRAVGKAKKKAAKSNDLDSTTKLQKPDDIDYKPYPSAAIDREEQIAKAEASAIQMSKFHFISFF